MERGECLIMFRKKAKEDMNLKTKEDLNDRHVQRYWLKIHFTNGSILHTKSHWIRTQNLYSEMENYIEYILEEPVFKSHDSEVFYNTCNILKIECQLHEEGFILKEVKEKLSKNNYISGLTKWNFKKLASPEEVSFIRSAGEKKEREKDEY